MDRSVKSADDLRLPQCPIPRPGERVLWYYDSAPRSGVLLGHTIEGKPFVKLEGFETTQHLDAFGQIRAEDPFHESFPNWHLLEQGQIKEPLPTEKEKFDNLLSGRTPPGPQYIELIKEIWNRGYEVFVVGGTVRDVLAEKKTNDVDVVTTMPLNMAMPLLKAMYRKTFIESKEHGYIRLGGKPGEGDPFVDLKVFSHSDVGTPNVTFSNRFDLDIGNRDFACNSVYYDPVNQALIDPTGVGIRDAENSNLTIVCEPSRRTPYGLAKIFIRFFKFQCRGFTANAETINQLEEEFIPHLSAMKKSQRVGYTKGQLLRKHPFEEHFGIVEIFEQKMKTYFPEVWERYFQPIKEDLLDMGA
jgi:hypothetical protein